MHAMILFAAIALPLDGAHVPAFPPDGVASAARLCGTAAKPADGQKPVVRSQRLGDLPPASEVKTVLRLVGPCPQPLVTRQGIGANKDKVVPVVGGAGVLPATR